MLNEISLRVDMFLINVDFLNHIKRLYLDGYLLENDEYESYKETFIPDELWNMTNLKWLKISGFDDEKISRDIEKLEKLETLILELHDLNSLPGEIQKLKKLKEVDLRETSIDTYKYGVEYFDSLEIFNGVKLTQYNNEKISIQDNSQTLQPQNQILYGPPGTGKTYHTNSIKDNFIYHKESMSDEEWLFDVIKDLTWFEVVLLSLHDIGGRAKVPELTKHPFVKAKSVIQGQEKVIPQSLWATLQSHTINESITVKAKSRTEPLVFDKLEDSEWILIEGYKEIVPDVLEVYTKYKEQKPQSQELKNYEFITFHQSYGYEEFVEGIRAIPVGEKGNEDGTEMIYKVTDGIFKKIAKRAILDPTHNYAIFIDEINRGNISKIFGELITLIEESKRLGNDEAMEITLPYSGEKFGVPKNLYIIGTMNTADRSIALMDTALRRRFEFEEMMPRPDLLGEVEGIDLEQLLIKINQRIEYLYDRDHTIGHAYFMGVKDKELLDSVMRNKVIPLLQEYFYDDWEKIALVLNDGFIAKDTQDASKLFDSMDDEYIEEDKYTYSIAEDFTEDSYRKIYGKIKENEEGE